MKLHFYGAVRGVTGSCYLLENNNDKLLIDCGAYQGKDSGQNNQEFLFNPEEIKAVVLTHAHFDHSGRLPLLVKKGFHGKIFTTAPTRDLTALILEDSARILADEAEKNNEKPLFSVDDVEKAISLIETVDYNVPFSPIQDSSVIFLNAGHILGSAMVKITIDNKNLFFSGDVGNCGNPILADPDPIPTDVNYVICESTYGNREHELIEERSAKLKRAVKEIIGRGGTLIIPSFSIERTQELLYEIDNLVDNDLIPDIPVYLDSPLAIKATAVYKKYINFLRFDRDVLNSPDRDFFNFPRLRLTLTVDESKKINSYSAAKIIIAGSGMMTGGRILHHLRRYLPSEKNGLLIIGYQAEGTLGREIFNGAKTVKIFNEEIDVKASIMAIGAFSAHGDRKQLADWLRLIAVKCEKVFLTHGDLDVKNEFKDYLTKNIGGNYLIPHFQEYWDL